MLCILNIIYYFCLMFLKTSEKCVKKFIMQILQTFVSAPGLAWEAALKKAEVKLELLNDIDMLLMVETGIREGICHAVHGYAKANNKYIKIYDKGSSYFKYWDVNNSYVWEMLQKLPVNKFEWIDDTSQFNEDFTKNNMKKVMKDIFLKLMFNILKKYMNFIMTYHFFPRKNENWKSRKACY